MLGEVEVLSDSPSRRTKTPALDEFGSNLTQMAAAGKLDPVVGRAKLSGSSRSWVAVPRITQC